MKKQINAAVFHTSLTQAGMNASQLATKLGVSREAVSKWQRGDSFPKPDKLLRLGMILNQPYQSLVQEPMAVNEPQVAYRAKANRKTKMEHVVWAKEAGSLLRNLVPYLPFDSTRPPALKSPHQDYDYAQEVVAEVRSQMKLSTSDTIERQHLIKQFVELDAVLIPVFWGEQKQHGQALHAYLPDSMTTWVWLDLDTKLHDFMFMMAHELGHAYSPSLTADAAEDFSDLFAQSLLYPHDVSKKAYGDLKKLSTIKERWEYIETEAQTRSISPYTIVKALGAYAAHIGGEDIDFGRYGSKLNRFSKTIDSVAESLFGGKHPEPAQYIDVCSTAFGTPFFSALQAFGGANRLAPPFLTKTMDLSLVDAKAICQELA